MIRLDKIRHIAGGPGFNRTAFSYFVWKHGWDEGYTAF
ncbi:hypothetical protein FHS19_004368 [Paenibacillus rhizosphaerae]|uniref:Uncharacterized protein n=1 Tax=Paenibacillus rhizosphaerae TaxID=297318 RepID=A0A839TT56_9BACL|nr:hypothetical protein [Paenibacillus rhizosphaerae]